jgi:hypothetical protein
MSGIYPPVTTRNLDETKTLSHIHLELENQLPTTGGRSVALDFARQHAIVCLNMS